MIGLLFNKSKSTISYCIGNNKGTTCQIFRQVLNDGREYEVKHYNLAVVSKIGYKIEVNKTIKFKEWAESVLYEGKMKSPLPIEVFEDGDFKLEVSISQKENTGWLTQEEMSNYLMLRGIPFLNM